MKPRILALYLPQFYPIKENDEWWGKGFTEWTNVGKAKPLWKGHDQPRVPADLGYYDLRLPEVREQQAELAREAGVTGFLYWHYWFGNGKRLLERVFNEVLESGKPDFPFALAWANHNWYSKSWGLSGMDKMLIEQTYPGKEDVEQHFAFLLKAFRDPRYIKVGGCPFFFVFRPDDVPDWYLQQLRQLTREAGFKDLYLVANVYAGSDGEPLYQKGYSAITENNMIDLFASRYRSLSSWGKLMLRIRHRLGHYLTGRPLSALDYAEYVRYAVPERCRDERVIPEIFPNWDHSPRSGKKAGVIYYNSKPEYFCEMAKNALEAIKDKPEEKQLIILKSWNEWGEGNYMEPDLSHGRGYIETLRRAIEEYVIEDKQ